MDRVRPSATEFAAAVTAISDAFGDPTRRDIYLYVRDADSGDGFSAAAIADHFDLHPNVARHHLEKLSAGGYLEATTHRPPDGEARAGRPSKRWRATERAGLDIPVRHDDILIALLGRALSRLPADEAEALAEEVGAEYGATMATSVGAGGDAGRSARSVRSALHAVASALTAHGFAARADSRGGQLRIVSEHCPFGGAAIEHPVICAVDRGMVRGMLAGLYGETSPATESSVAYGDDECVTTVE